MHTFTDVKKREWSLVITIATIRRVRELASIDLMQITNGATLEKLADPVMLADVLFVVCKAQADAQGISSEDFGNALHGDVIEAATAAFLAELVSFFPSQTRTLLQRVLDAGKTQQERALAVANAQLDSLQKATPGTSSPSAPASSDSTPAG